MLLSLLRCSFHLFQQLGKRVEVYRVGVDVEHSAVTVDELIRRVAVDADKAFDGVLLLCGQVVVDYVVTLYLIFLDDVLP